MSSPITVIGARQQGHAVSCGASVTSIRGRWAGNAPRFAIYNPGQYQWDIALFKNVNLRAKHSLQFRAEIFNFLNHANLSGADANPTSATFGRITGKDGSRRDIQLSLRFLF